MTKHPMPAPGWTTPAKVVEVYDGDTCIVEVARRVRVRLLDCWSPEVKTKDAAEKVRGIQARDYLRKLMPDGCEVFLHVPIESESLGDRLTLGRVLGRIYIAGADVSEMMVLAGHATVSKKA